MWPAAPITVSLGFIVQLLRDGHVLLRGRNITDLRLSFKLVPLLGGFRLAPARRATRLDTGEKGKNDKKNVARRPPGDYDGHLERMNR